ncbi:MAG TPA: asparagine synthase-related protein [Pseudolabrys sp.]|nr:asparagine synthase-related protein [Pseudolabrys sp.]
MSAIAGLLRFDGSPVGRAELERAASALHQYGPDRSRVLTSGHVGFAHVLMRMTPEDRFDRQPLHGANGALLTADVRIDNRDDLLARLGLPAKDTADWPDARILLAAWETLGDAVWPLLRGPFAAAIWDPCTRALTLARDQLGLNVVMWHKSPRFFAFATMPNGLFALADVPRRLSEEKFADFLVLNHARHETTIYRDLFRVPPGHILRVSAGGSVVLTRYWSAAEIKPIRLPTDDDYAEGLRACLDRAVRRQMRSAYPVGVLLSGGLDSSSVSALAARALAERNERLAAFTGVPRRGFDAAVAAGAYADETPYVEAIRSAIPNLDVNYVRSETSGLAELERVFVALDGPVRNPSNLGFMLALLREARAQGRRVLLSGMLGNCTVSWSGWSQSAGHLLRGRMLTAYRQWRLYRRCTHQSRWTAMRKLLLEPLTPRPLGDWLDRRRHPDRLAPWQAHAPIRADFAVAMGVDARARCDGHDFLYRLRPDERRRSLAHVDYAGDWYAAEKALTGVEVRDPTADIDVVSYCLGVPSEQYLAESADRSLIRRAMRGLLPDSILHNRLSGLQSADWHETLARERDELARQLAEIKESPLVCRIIDLLRLENALTSWPASGWHTPGVFQEHHLALTRGLAGARFLRWFEQAN